MAVALIRSVRDAKGNRRGVAVFCRHQIDRTRDSLRSAGDARASDDPLRGVRGGGGQAGAS
jgi:hypothetical protein